MTKASAKIKSFSLENFALKIFALLLAFLVFSCASMPRGGAKVNAFDTLDEDALVYIRLPVNIHSELTNSFLKKMIGDQIPDKYIKNITDRIDTAYIALGSPSSKKRVQISCDGSLSTATKLALSSADSWKKETRRVGELGVYTIYKNSSANMELCVPGSSMICIAGDLTSQLTRYSNEIAAQGVSALLTGSASNANNSSWKESEVYRFVGSAQSENVRIYLSSPLSFISNLIGMQLSASVFQLKYVEADIALMDNGKYSIDLDIEFARSGLVSRAAGILNLAMMLTSSTLVTVDDTHLRLSGIQLSIEQLQKILL